MCPVLRKRTLLGNERANLAHIRNMIKFHIWCPPDRPRRGIETCTICEAKVDLDKGETSFYAVWCGFVCLRCADRYKKEIEDLSEL